MKQILQNLGSGETTLAEVPRPKRMNGFVIVETSKSVVSLGTEKMLIDFGKKGWIAKARSQPDKVKQVWQKIRTDGLWATLSAVKSKLDTPIPLGYCNVGTIVETDPNMEYRTGDRIVSNGHHAQFVSVPNNLSAIVPENVSDEHAAFVVVSAIALQGIRLINPTLGEKFVVSGLGLIGLLAVQILRANGCQVLGIDFDPRKLELAREFGAETVDLSAGADPTKAAENWTFGTGVDGVLVTASTKSDDLMHQSAQMCRKRGRIVLVGVAGLNLQRSDFYEKELTFQVSCSYGPGRYDEDYEKRGFDYPIGFARWTEKRNFEAVLQLMADGKLNVEPLITHRFLFDDALDAYKAINERGALGILLDYKSRLTTKKSTTNALTSFSIEPTLVTPSEKNAGNSASAKHGVTLLSTASEIGVAFIGAGGFATKVLLPLLPNEGLRRRTIMSSSGVTAAHCGKKFRFEKTTDRLDEILNNRDINTVVICTPHDSHGSLVAQSLEAGKHVFVEKPLAIRMDEIDRIESISSRKPEQLLLVGFNRRFSTHMQSIRQWTMASSSSKSIVITVNAGEVPADHWIHDPSIGGGRIIGEVCHFIDTARYLANCPITSYSCISLGGSAGRLADSVSIQLGFADGSVAAIQYLTQGSKSFPKERIEVFVDGRVAVCENFRRTTEYGSRRRHKTFMQEKGHAAEIASFFRCIREGGDWPIPLAQQIEVSRITIELSKMAISRR